MILYGKQFRDVKKVDGVEPGYVYHPYRYIDALLCENPQKGLPNLAILLKVDAQFDKQAHRGTLNPLIPKLSPNTPENEAVIREICWAIDEVEMSLIEGTKPKNYTYYFIGDDAHKKVLSIIKACNSKITANIKDAYKAFKDGNSIPGRYLNIINKLGNKEITEENVLHAIYQKPIEKKYTYNKARTSALRKEIQEVIMAQYGYTKEKYPELLDRYVFYSNPYTGSRRGKLTATANHSRLQSISRYSKFRSNCNHTQEVKDHWVFCFRHKYKASVSWSLEDSPMKQVHHMIELTYNIIGNNMNCLEKYVDIPDSGVKRVYSKIRVEHSVFKKCYKLILCYILLTSFNDKMTSGAKSAISEYVNGAEVGNSVLEQQLKSDIIGML